MKEKKFRITVSESQLRLISACVEDIHRFMSGDLVLYNCTSMLDEMHALHEEMRKLQHFVTPELSRGAYHKWSGISCPDEHRRKFIAETYYLYREIKHFDAVRRNIDSVYRSETLRCADSGMPIFIEEVKEEEEKLKTDDHLFFGCTVKRVRATGEYVRVRYKEPIYSEDIIPEYVQIGDNGMVLREFNYKELE